MFYFDLKNFILILLLVHRQILSRSSLISQKEKRLFFFQKNHLIKEEPRNRIQARHQKLKKRKELEREKSERDEGREGGSVRDTREREKDKGRERKNI